MAARRRRTLRQLLMLPTVNELRPDAAPSSIAMTSLQSRDLSILQTYSILNHKTFDNDFDSHHVHRIKLFSLLTFDYEYS